MRMKLWPKFYTIKTIELKSFLSIFVAERCQRGLFDRLMCARFAFNYSFEHEP